MGGMSSRVLHMVTDNFLHAILISVRCGVQLLICHINIETITLYNVVIKYQIWQVCEWVYVRVCDGRTHLEDGMDNITNPRV